MYLSPTEAQQRLIESEVYTPESVPSVAFLLPILTNIQAVINQWLNRNLERSEYAEILTSSEYSPCANTAHYPILKIIKIESLFPSKEITVHSKMWTGALRTIDFLGQNRTYKVTYEAGYDPIPQVVIDTVFQVLILALEQPDPRNLAFLQSFAKDAEEVQLPGGVRKRYKVQEINAETKPETELDRLLKPLEKFRKVYIT